jgi:hypothetical protein
MNKFLYLDAAEKISHVDLNETTVEKLANCKKMINCDGRAASCTSQARPSQASVSPHRFILK